MEIAEKLAEYVSKIDYNDIDKNTLYNTKKLIVDTMGCAIGAYDETPIKIAKKTIQEAKGKFTATILGTHMKTAPQYAAFINGGMARYFDYNDTYDAKEFSHPSDNILPVIAVAEAMRKGGEDIILGTVIAYEVQARLADAASLWRHGWDQVIYGLVSTACAASKLMDLTKEQTKQAINIALNSHLVMRQVRAGEISMWKAMAFSNSARNAILATMLAKNGMTGPSPVFEGEMGFWKQVTGKFDLDIKKFGGMVGKFKINESFLKFFPAETRAQTAIFAARELKREFRSIDQIGSVDVGVNEASYKIIGKEPEKWNPQTKETADHSLPFIVAAAFMDGDINTNTFLERRFRDKRTLDFMKRIRIYEDKKYTKMFNEGGTVNASNVAIKLKNGKRISKEVIYSKGHPQNPLTQIEIELKFKRLALKHLGWVKTKLVLNALWNLEKLNKASELFTMIGRL